jgi:2-oxoglutarate dehydrogenase E1 component
MCSGKVYYDLMEALEETKQTDVAVVRVEQLYPIPHQELSFIFNSYPGDAEIVWCQEEPRNQGAWYQTMHNLRADMHEGQALYYAGRPSSASPAVGYYSVHIEEQKQLVTEAITIGAGQKY